MILSYVQTKGGTGKSTLAINTLFSKTMADRFSSIALVELDPQGTLKNWWKSREEQGRVDDKYSFHHISSTQREIIQESIKVIASHNELLVLDIPGESTSKLHTKFACAFSDLVIIPMRTSTNDESAFADNLLPIIKELIKEYPAKKNNYYVIPTFTSAQSNKNKFIDYFKDILPHYVGCLDSVFPFRGLFENFNRDGMNLIEYSESVASNKRLKEMSEKAVNDVEEIAMNIIKIMEAKNGNT